MKERALRVTLVAALAAMLSLMDGCGGGGGGSGGSGRVAGRVVLPAGSSLAMTSLKVSSALGDSAVSSSGSFAVPVLDQGPTLVSLNDQAGNLVMLGYVDTTAGATSEVSPATTSEALLFLALGAFTLPPDNQQTAMTLIAQDPAFQPLVAAVTGRIAADPIALQDGDAQLVAALQQARNGILKSSRSALGRMKGAPAPAASATTIAVSRPPAGRNTRQSGRATPLIFLVDPSPSAQQSGVQVQLDPGGAGILLTNNFRRHCTFAIYEVGTQDSSGNKTDINPAKQIGDFQDLPSTQRLGLFTALGDVITGHAPFTPVSTAPINLQLEPGSVKTFYKVVVFGPSTLFVNPDPPIFLDPHFTTFVPRWRAEIASDNTLNVIESFIIPIFETLGLVKAGDLAADPARKFIGAFNAQVLQNALGQANSIKSAVEVLMAGFGTQSVLSFDAANAVTGMLNDQIKQQNAQNLQLLQAQAPAKLKALASAGAVLKAISIAMEAFDLGVVLDQLAQSNNVEAWSVTVFQSPVHINPDTATVDIDHPVVTLSVSIPGQQDLSGFVFQWSTSGTMGHLEDTSGLNQHPVTGQLVADTSVDYLLDASKNPNVGQADTVTVEAFQKPDTVNPIGQATAKVTFGKVQLCSGPPPATLPPFGSGTGEVDTPAISLDKGTYQDGDLMTVSVSLAGPGADNSSWEVSPQGATGVELLDQLVSVDGVPRSGRASFSLAANATEQHTLVFRIHVPKDANGNPVTECAGGLVNNSFIGPLVFLTVFGQHGEEVNTVAFYNVQPASARSASPRGR